MKRASLFPLGVALFFIAFPVVSEGWRLHVRSFNPDEFQHVHAAWSVARGQTLYRDFFEHHHPVTAWALAVPLRNRPVEHDFASAWSFLINARRGFYALNLLTLLGAAFLARGLWGRGGVVAAAFLAGAMVFWENGVEIRPDVPGALLVLLAALTQFRAGRRNEGLGFFISGLLWGAALGVSPKAVFPAIGAAIPLALGPRNLPLPERRRGWRLACLWVAGTVLVLGATALVLTAQGALSAFWSYGVKWNLGYASRFGPGPAFFRLLRDTPLVIALGGLGFFAAAKRALPGSPEANALLFWILTATVAGLFFNPVPYGQSFLFVLPFWAVAGAGLWVRLEGALASRGGPARAAALLSLALVLGLGVPTTARLRPFDRNTPQWALLETIHRHVPPDAPVLDAWTGLGVFRPHVDFFPQRNVEMRKMLPPGWERRLLNDLQSGALKGPRALVGDREFRALGPDWDRWIRDHFEPVNGDVVWVWTPKASKAKSLENTPSSR